MARISKAVHIQIDSIKPRICRYVFTPKTINLEIEYQEYTETENVVFDGENVIFDGEQVIN